MDQIMTITLLGQTQMAVRKAGMMAAFINLKKAYDTVDRGILWKCLEQMELKGHLGCSYKSSTGEWSVRLGWVHLQH